MRLAETATLSKVFIVLCAVFLITGCGSRYEATDSAKVSREPSSASEVDGFTEENESLSAGVRFSQVLGASSEGIKNRKIIYNTNIGLVVEDYVPFENQLPTVVAQRGGFVASSNTDRRYDNSQYGTWVVRLPVAEYSEFLNGISALGFAESRTENAQDVTEEYVDTAARIKNKKQLEVRVLEMLDERRGPLKDVLEIERELSRIREAIERMEGRLRFLADRTSLATVTIQCREEKSYQPAAAPTLSSRINNSWSSSIGSLRKSGENFLVNAIGALPWLILYGLVFGLFALLTRKYWRGAIRLGMERLRMQRLETQSN